MPAHTRDDLHRLRLIQVQSWQDIGKHLRRIVFHSPELADYPFRCTGAPFKLLLPHEGQRAPVLPDYFENGRPRWTNPADKPYSRTYTVRAYDAAACTFTVDFVLHGDNGPASAFACQVEIGQTVAINAPRNTKDPMLVPAAEYLLIGDLTAVPAIQSMLADMDENARGRVILLLPDSADLPADFTCPPHVTHTVFTGGVEQYAAVTAAARASQPQSEDCYVWIAAEAGLVSALRQLARQEWQLPIERCCAVPYWRLCEAEERFHSKRHEFIDADTADS